MRSKKPSVENALHSERVEILLQFGRLLRAKRREAGLSQEALALRSGIDRSYVGGAERGERNVSVTNLVRFARALNVEPAKLLEIKPK
jgi:transcriptional regulator with XRE-family HTH domain